MNELEPSEIIGIIGAIGYLMSYAALQIQPALAKNIHYFAANFMSAFLVACSLCFAFNLASFIIQIFWMIVSLYGIFKCWIPAHQKASIKSTRAHSPQQS